MSWIEKGQNKELYNKMMQKGSNTHCQKLENQLTLRNVIQIELLEETCRHLREAF